MNSSSDFLLHLLLFTISLAFLTFGANAQTYSNISLGSSLSAGNENTSWASPYGEFAFGFHPLPQTDLFLLSIWFHKIPERTVVWSANGDQPVRSGSKVELTTTGHLLLTDHQGREVWKKVGRTTAYAALLDTGNLVLVDRSNFDYIWQSFDEPTDTMLPTQKLGKDTKLFSRQTETNFTKGRFYLMLQNDGSFALYPVDYWTAEPSNVLLVNETLKFTFGRRDFYERATLDFDGVFRQYQYPKASARNGSWPQAWSVLDSIGSDICMRSFDLGSGVCGYNSYCSLDDKRPSCICLPKFS